MSDPYLKLIITKKVKHHVFDLLNNSGILHSKQVTEHHHLSITQDGSTSMPRTHPQHLQCYKCHILILLVDLVCRFYVIHLKHGLNLFIFVLFFISHG